ncbi:hypothetical protein E2I00_007106 [Balaenoptera physalus]|uniref:PDZ domain-containing protein n=1 Tax=Balaenoptera physalus TaxID=9770 RepID=A0A6A1QFY5_BALPH|nr:hypothetical protein E2I00_007106 [Balaenoptera physalus]
MLSPRHEEAKHLLQRARMKARTRPVRASHDIVPTLAQGSRTLVELGSLKTGKTICKTDWMVYMYFGHFLFPKSLYPMTPKGSLYTSYSTPSAIQTIPTHQGYETTVNLRWAEKPSLGPEDDPCLQRQPPEREHEVRGSSPRLRASRPRGGHRWFQKAEMGPLRSPQAPPYLPGLELVEVLDEVTEGTGQTPEGTLLPREDAFSKPLVQDSNRASLGSQPGPGPENHWAQPVDSRTAYAIAFSMKVGSSAPGRQAQVVESQESLGTDSPNQSHAEPSAHHQAQQPTASLSPESWVPTPPSSKKTTSPVSHRKAALAGLRRPGDQGEPMDAPVPSSRSVVPRACELTRPQPQPRSPCVTPSTGHCNNGTPQGLQEPWGGAIFAGSGEKGAYSQKPAAPPEDHGDGGLQGCLASAAVGTISSMGITFSPASEEPAPLPPTSCPPLRFRALPGVSVGPSLPSAAPSDKNKKSSGSISSTLGLKKFFLALTSQGTRPKLGKSRSYSVEQLQPPAPSPASHTSAPKMKRAPSLQSLHPVSPSRQRRKAASFQNLHSLLSGKVDRSNLYLVGEPGDHNAADRPAKAPPRRSLSVEDVSAPGLARAVGRMVEVFPDGTSQLQLQRSPEGTFGFCVASGNGRRDSGFYVQEMADESTAKLYSGLLGVGDEILEVNGAKVAGLGLAHIRELLAHAESLSIRVLRQRPVPR